MKTIRKITAGLLSLALVLTAFAALPRRTSADSSSSSHSTAGELASSAYANGHSSGAFYTLTGKMQGRVASVTNFGSGLAGAAGIANNVTNLATQGLPGHNQTQQVVQALTITADLTMGMVGLALTLGGVAAGPAFIAAAFVVGMVNAFFWSDTGMQFMDDIGNWLKPSDDVDVYKPNIYLYTADETPVSVTFGKPGLVTVSVPDYRDGWTVLAHDGLVNADGADYGFLFYEAKTDPALYDYTEAFFIPADGRAEVFAKILAGYNFTERETRDFIEFWDEMLGDANFLMYPQLTETVDRTMPVSVSADFAEYFRVWFAFAAYEGQAYEPAAPEFFERTNESTLLEWGGFIVK